MWLLLMGLACGKKEIKTAKPKQVEDLGDGASKLDTVVFEGVAIKEKEQEESLQEVEKPDEYNGVEKYWTTIEEIESLLATYQDFIQYEYTADDDWNANYLVIEKMEIFHQLTGSAYDIVMAKRNYHEVSAGIYVAGATELRYAEMWNRYPVPENLDHNAHIVFGHRVRETVGHLNDEGKDKLERIIEHYFRSKVSGEYTLAALQELQWRFPEEYPRPVSLEDVSELRIFHQYADWKKDDAIKMMKTWEGSDQEQRELLYRFKEKELLVGDIKTTCEGFAEKYDLLGPKIVDLCVLKELMEAETLIYRYPPQKLTTDLAKAQQLIEKELVKKAENIKNWNDSEYQLFWKKEAQLLLRQYQFEKMQLLREKGLSDSILEIDSDIWQYRQEQEMKKSTADIFDAHVLELERLIRIIIYDIKDLKWEERGPVLRDMYVIFPKTLQELEFRSQALLFAFPENHSYRSRMLLALLDAYSLYLSELPKLETAESKTSIAQIVQTNRPFVLELYSLLEEQSLSEEQQRVLQTAKDRLAIVEQ